MKLSKKKIAILVPSLKYLGPIIVMENLVMNQKTNYEFVLISLRKNDKQDLLRYVEFKTYEINMKKLPSKNIINKIMEILKKEKISVLHVNSFWPTILAKDIPLKKIVTVHSNPYVDFTCSYGKLLGTLMSHSFCRALRKYTKVVCISEYIKDVINLPNSTVVYNSVEDVQPDFDNKKLVNFDYFNIYTVSVLNKIKNVTRMIDIIYEMKVYNPKIRLYIVGDGNEYDALSDKIKKYKLENLVVLLGKKDKNYIKKLASQCDCFLFTSLNEGFGLSLVEAMRDKKYICCSDFLVAHELFSFNCDAQICIENQEFIHYLKKLIDLKAERCNKVLESNKNRDLYLKRYTTKLMGMGYKNIYDSLFKKNVLYYIPFYDVGGIESLMNEFMIRKNEKYNFSILVEHEISSELECFLKSRNVSIYELPDFKHCSIITYLRKLKRIFQEVDVDIFHSHDYSLRFFPMLIAKKFKVPVRICHIHTSSFEGKFLLPIKKIFARFNLFFSTNIIACSNESKKFVNDKNCKIIYNGVSSEKFIYEDEIRKKVRSDYHIKEKDILLVQIGRLVPVKNFEFTLSVMQNLPENFKLFILGDGFLKENIEMQILEKNLNDRVMLLGTRRNVNDFMSAADIFLLPSLFEGLPITLLEATSNGLISIVSSNVTDEVSCFDVISYLDLDIDKWENKIKLTKNRINRKEYNNLFKNSKFDISNFIKEMEKIYDKSNL